MPTARLALVALLALVPAAASAAITSTVADVDNGGRPLRLLTVMPDAPIAHLVSVPGGSGAYGIGPDGSMFTRESRCSPQARNRTHFAERDVAVTLVDGTPLDLIDVVRHLRALRPVPVFIAGGSSSTVPSTTAVSRLPAGEPAGLILGAPENVPESLAASITTPVHVSYHLSDPAHVGPQVFSRLTGTPHKEQKTFTGGSSGGCGYHLLEGLDDEYVDAIVDFIQRRAPLLVTTPQAGTATAVEYYNAALDHYFVTHVADEIGKLDAGTIRGWMRTGESFRVYTAAGAGTSPVCRFYIPPAKGDSHFYGRGKAECDATASANPTFVNEDPQFFHVTLPVAGACPAGLQPVYRVYSNRPDANHHYATSRAVRDQMVGKGWLAEGDGPDLVVMCAP